MAHADGYGMGASRYEELEAWQLCRQLADEIAALLATRKPSDDFDLFNQLKSASRTSCRNVAEGFGRYYPKEFAPFTIEREAELIRLRDRAVAATVRLLKYLESDPPQGPERPTKRSRG